MTRAETIEALLQTDRPELADEFVAQLAEAHHRALQGELEAAKARLSAAEKAAPLAAAGTT